jgi:hypothetical protein
MLSHPTPPHPADVIPAEVEEALLEQPEVDDAAAR